MIYPPTFCTVEVWGWISNFIPHFTGHMIIYWCMWKKTLQYDDHIYGLYFTILSCMQHALSNQYSRHVEKFIVFTAKLFSFRLPHCHSLQQLNDIRSSSHEMYVPTYEINDNGAGETLLGRRETLFRISKPSNVRVHVRVRECARARVLLCEVDMTLIARFMGPTCGPSGADRISFLHILSIVTKMVPERS